MVAETVHDAAAIRGDADDLIVPRPPGHRRGARRRPPIEKAEYRLAVLPGVVPPVAVIADVDFLWLERRDDQVFRPGRRRKLPELPLTAVPGGLGTAVLIHPAAIADAVVAARQMRQPGERGGHRIPDRHLRLARVDVLTRRVDQHVAARAVDADRVDAE